MKNNAIELSGLTKQYAGFTLGPVDLTLPGGAILGLIGENGAGKTTLMKTMLGVTRADGGTVRLLGREHDIRLILPEDISRHGAAPPLFSSLYSTRKPRLRKASRRDFLKNPRLGKKSLFPVGFCAIIDSV